MPHYALLSLYVFSVGGFEAAHKLTKCLTDLIEPITSLFNLMHILADFIGMLLDFTGTSGYLFGSN